MAKSIQYVSAISSCVGCWKSQSKVYSSRKERFGFGVKNRMNAGERTKPSSVG
ncbi:unnamed protein product [Arabidopsis halleri]